MSFLRQLLLAVKLWLLAVALNTILGTIFLASVDFASPSQLLGFGIIYGALYALPVVIVLLFIIVMWQVTGKSGVALFKTLLVTTVALSGVVFFFFWQMTGLEDAGMAVVLQCIVVLSGIVSLLTFQRSICKNSKQVAHA